MTLQQHTFDNGTQDASIVGAPGEGAGIGINGDGFNHIAVSTDSTLTFDNIRTAPGAMACKVTLGSGAAPFAYTGWDLTSTATLSTRGMFYFTEFPPTGTAIQLVDLYNGPDIASIWLISTGLLQVRDATGAVVGTFSSTIPLNKWFRLEAQWTVATAVAGAVTVQRFDNLRSAVATDSLSLTGKNFTGSCVDVAFGAPTTTGTPTGFVFWYDEVAWQNVVAVIGPPSASKMANVTITDVQYDYGIGGVPVISAASAQSPMGRKTAEYRKDQVDQSSEPGEHSLVYWWLRSQSSFHGGTGIEYEEPDPNLLVLQYRFKFSSGLDLFTKKGQATLLNTTVKLATTNTATTQKPVLMGCNDSAGGGDRLFTNSGLGTAVNYYTAVANAGTNTGTAVTWGGANTPVSACNDGTSYYIADSVGIWKGTLAGGAGAKIWNTGSASTVVGWMKQRLVTGIANKLYELSPGVAGAPALPADGTSGHIYTHPNVNWVWTEFTEGPAAIYVAGYAGAKSAIYKMTVGTGNGLAPTIAAPVSIWEPPPGELVNALRMVNGKYLAIGTTKGLRIAIVDDGGNLEVGPLNHTDRTISILGLTSKDRLVYFTWTGMTDSGPSDDLFPSGSPFGQSGIGVLDLATPTDQTNPYILSPSRYAYATYLLPSSGSHQDETSWAVTMVGSSGQAAFSIGSIGDIYLEDPANKYTQGILRTGKIRFHTLEAKLFKTLKVRTGVGLQGEIDVYGTTPDGTNYLLGAFTTQNEVDHQDITLPVIAGVEWMYLTFYFNKNVSNGPTSVNGPTFTGYTVRALPAQKNQRLIILPVYIYDYESDKMGQPVGYDGQARDRLMALEAAEEARDAIAYQDFTDNGLETSLGRLVVIDDITFTEMNPPAKFGGVGGVATITLRTVT